MRKSEILNGLTEGQLCDVECAVTKWKDCGAPGMFGFVSSDDLDEIKESAVTVYKNELSLKVKPIATASTILLIGGLIIKSKMSKKKKKGR